MSNGVNKVILVGNLGRDPEVRHAQSGSSVCNLRLAVTERRKDGDDYKDHTEWMTVVAFGKTGENAGKYLLKGRQIYVEGRLQTRSYKDKDGNEKWSTEVIASQIVFLGGGNSEGEARGSGGSGGRVRSNMDAAAPPHDAGFVDDDLPFAFVDARGVA